MQSTPRKPSRRGGVNTPSTPVRVRGFFNDGQWFCDCQPRKPAVKHQVKKEGPNKGKRFYGCQLERNKQCGFFLWEDMAQTRERGALFGNSRTEPRPHPQPWVGSDDNNIALPDTPSKSVPRQNIFGGSQRQRSGSESDGSLNTDGKMELEIQEQLKMMGGSQGSARGSQSSSSQALSSTMPQTPSNRKRQRAPSPSYSDDLGSEEERAMVALEKTASAKNEPKSFRDAAGMPSTPSAGGSFSSQKSESQGKASYLPPTPVTRGTVGDTTGERTQKRARFAEPAVGAVYESPPSATLSQPSATMAPTTPRTAASTTAPTTPGTVASTTSVASAHDDDNITDTILDLLANQPISAVVRRQVRDALELHARRVSGVRAARDMVRSTMAAKEARIAELQEKVADLENTRRMQKEKVRELMASMEGQ